MPSSDLLEHTVTITPKKTSKKYTQKETRRQPVQYATKTTTRESNDGGKEGDTNEVAEAFPDR